MPDFDIDFCMERRERVIAHVADLYGHDAVSQIVTFGTMAARLVVRDVARVQDKPFGLADRLSKMIPFEVGMTLEKAVAQEQELREFIARDEDAAEIMEMAYKLEGTVRNIGKHAGGVVIAPDGAHRLRPAVCRPGRWRRGFAVRPQRCRGGRSRQVRLSRTQDVDHHRLGGQRDQRRTCPHRRAAHRYQEAAAR